MTFPPPLRSRGVAGAWAGAGKSTAADQPGRATLGTDAGEPQPGCESRPAGRGQTRKRAAPAVGGARPATGSSRLREVAGDNWLTRDQPGPAPNGPCPRYVPPPLPCRTPRARASRSPTTHPYRRAPRCIARDREILLPAGSRIFRTLGEKVRRELVVVLGLIDGLCAIPPRGGRAESERSLRGS